MDELTSSLIVDADQIEGVVSTVPSTVQPVRLLDGYSSEKLVPCAFCKQKQRHYKGFVVELTDGSLALAGNCCATKIGGKSEVTKLAARVAKKEKAANLAREKQALHDALTLLQSEISKTWVPLEQAMNSRIAEVFLFFGVSPTPKSVSFQRAESQCVAALSKFDEFYRHRDKIPEKLSIACEAFSRSYNDLASLVNKASRSSIGSLAVNNPKFGERNCTVLENYVICTYRDMFGESQKTRFVIPPLELPPDTISEVLDRIKVIHQK